MFQYLEHGTLIDTFGEEVDPAVLDDYFFYAPLPTGYQLFYEMNELD